MNGSRAIRWVVGVCIVAAVLTATGWVVAFDHPTAAAGIGSLSTFEEFSHAEQAADQYTSDFVVSEPAYGVSTRLTWRQYGNGTTVSRVDRPSGVDGSRTVTTVERPEGTYSTELRYLNRSAVDASVRDRAIRVDGARAYVDGQEGYWLVIATAVEETLNRTQFVRNGAATRDGERLHRYDAVGRAGNDLPPALDDHPEGYLLADPATGALRSLAVSHRYSGDPIRIRISVTSGVEPVPSWADAVQANRSMRSRPST